MRVPVSDLKILLFGAVTLHPTSLSAAVCVPVTKSPVATTEMAIAPAGYRVQTVRWDPVLQRRWATVSSCEHPEWPPYTVLLRDGGASSNKIAHPSIVVHIGDTVRLRNQEKFLRIEMAVIAEEGGALGDTIRVRLPGLATSESTSGLGSFPRTARAVVLGPHDVEMEP